MTPTSFRPQSEADEIGSDHVLLPTCGRSGLLLEVGAHWVSCEVKINRRHGAADRNTVQLPPRGEDLDQRSGNDPSVVVLDLTFNGVHPAG